MFKKILIANRGEIACRIIKTAKKMKIATVAVYSDADANALHVKFADEAMHIGPSPVDQSYLLGEIIIKAALDCGAQAIHPGYGFLSENPEFVEAVEAAGLVFIGPSAKAIRAMGLKDAAKALMEKSGVPVVPGYHGDMQEPGFLAAKANEIGYPVLIKARAGGGGKGMRRVDAAQDFSAALGACRSEAKSSFGDDRVLIEKYILNPRHIEVQVFGDNHGNTVHLYERDCSLQRRHQKVIEEAPAPGMTEEMRTAMTDAAINAAKAVGYSGAGTVEFIVDGAKGLRPNGFWFMEMNTRLQVEHPVTEMITGLDLVEWQLRVASGEELPLPQESITLSGHSFEARLYAENVPKGFLPAIGTLEALEFDQSARIDTGVEEKDTISPFYDPMIAKIITHSETRDEALDDLYAALQHTKVAGTVTNKAFLARLCLQESFRKGTMDTGLIEREIDDLTILNQPTQEDIVITALIVSLLNQENVPNPNSNDHSYFSLWGSRSDHITLNQGDTVHSVTLSSSDGVHFTGELHQVKFEMTQRGIDFEKLSNHLISSRNKMDMEFSVWPGHIAVYQDGNCHTFEVPDPLMRDIADGAASGKIISPMPGLVKQLFVSVGDHVEKGAPLLVLEAMKMEHTLNAPRDGTLSEITFKEGDQVVDGAMLIAMEEEA